METENSKSKEGLIQSQIVMPYILQGPISKFRSAGKSDKSVETLLHDIAGLHSCLWHWTLLAPLGMENTSCFWVIISSKITLPCGFHLYFWKEKVATLVFFCLV